MRFLPEPGSPLDRLATFLMANLLWLGLSVLIVPMPLATVGLFATLAPWVRGRDVELFGTFFGTIRRQWLKSMVIGLADAILAALLIVNFRALDMMDINAVMLWFVRSVNIFIGVTLVLMNLYIWPLLVLFDLPLRRLFDLSWRLAFAHPFWSFLIMVAASVPLLLGLVVPPVFMVLVIFSTIALIVNWGAWRIIRKYATPEELADLDKP
jgi:uncharacterized membrane protein YesL